jgi:glutamyl-tRNA synthetase
MTDDSLAHAIFPDHADLATLDALEAAFPPRALAASAMVTRVAPSPTGMMHIGGLYAALINHRLARQSGGVFYLRVEDTDQARSIPGAFETIVSALADYDIPPQEGPTLAGDTIKEVGKYGPYVQSRRRQIYRAVVLEMVRRGHAYACFLTKAELDELRNEQQRLGITTGLYGEWAAARRSNPRDSLARIARGDEFVIRFNPPFSSGRAQWVDLIRGALETADNQLHVVLLKSDGLPTYHLAHVVDDHFMRTTHVIRAEEWLSSVPLHLQLFQALGWAAPRYAHLAALQKQDGASRRKLSKRKDPEANVLFYWERGIATDAVVEYLLNLANPTFEEWRAANSDAPHTAFALSLDKMMTAGPLVDLDKLLNISRQRFSTMPIDKLYATALAWTRTYAPVVAAQMQADPALTKRALDIERGGASTNAMRYTTLADVPIQLRGFFAPLLPDPAALEFPSSVARDDVVAVLTRIDAELPSELTPDQFFPWLKQIAAELRFAQSPKQFKQEPAAYKGHVGDVAMVFRVAVFGGPRSPDLGHVAVVLGADEVRARCRRAIAYLTSSTASARGL